MYPKFVGHPEAVACRMLHCCTLVEQGFINVLLMMMMMMMMMMMKLNYCSECKSEFPSGISCPHKA